jgi:hypothetical protein
LEARFLPNAGGADDEIDVLTSALHLLGVKAQEQEESLRSSSESEKKERKRGKTCWYRNVVGWLLQALQ